MKNKKLLKVGLIGNGAIARVVSRHCEAKPDRFEITTALVLPEDGNSVGRHGVTLRISEMLASSPDVVVEAASQAAVEMYGKAILEHGIDLVVSSIGALAKTDLLSQLDQAASESGARVILPSGALAGLDGLSSAALDDIRSVALTTRKPPMAWSGAPGVEGIDLKSIQRPEIIFEGTAREATLAFPKNANVAAALAFSAVGMDLTKVTLIADPGASRNSHHIVAECAFGNIETSVESESSPDNPKTSRLAALSITRVLDRLTENIGF